MSQYGYLAHHGVKGMRWGVRNYQNADGSLTAEGKARYYNSDGSRTKAGTRYEAKQYANATKQAYQTAKGNLKSFKRNAMNEISKNGLKGYRSELKGLKGELKNAKRDYGVAGNKFNTSKYKLKYRDADASTKVKMARINKVQMKLTAATTAMATRMLMKDTIKAATATYAQAGQKSMTTPQMAALFAKNMGVQLNNRAESISKAFDTAKNVGGSIGKAVGKNIAYKKSLKPSKPFGEFRELPWGYIEQKH